MTRIHERERESLAAKGDPMLMEMDGGMGELALSTERMDAAAAAMSPAAAAHRYAQFAPPPPQEVKKGKREWGVGRRRCRKKRRRRRQSCQDKVATVERTRSARCCCRRHQDDGDPSLGCRRARPRTERALSRSLRPREGEKGLSGKSATAAAAAARRRLSFLSLSASASRTRQSVSILRLGISGDVGVGPVVKFTICLLIRSATIGGEIYISITATTTTTVGTEIDERN